MSFPPVHATLAAALSAKDYLEPTPVQRAVLQPEVGERDLVVSAQTGSGKTVAYGLAMGTTLLGEAARLPRGVEPLALIIAPTRELALQVHRELEWLYGPAGGRVVSCVGGMDARKEARALEAGCHIVVGTPGRLRDHLERGRLEIGALKVVVLDEADEMLDLGFREDLEFILEATPESRRTLLFSATIPKAIAALARTFQRDALRIDTIAHNQAHGDIEYRAIRIAPNEVEYAVVNVLRYFEAGATLVFCSTREAVKRLYAALLERGFSAVALSGELSQNERSHALQALRDGRARVCVATDVAARGLDLPDLGLVIHADLPTNRETLLHRSGRTGRAGRKGVCALLVPYTRRRKAELLLGQAGVTAAWSGPPLAEEIRVRDQQRLMEDPMFTEEKAEEDIAFGNALLAVRTGTEIATALARLYRARLPAPEDIYDSGPGPERGRERDAGPRGRETRAYVPKERERERETRASEPRGRETLGRETHGRDTHPQRAWSPTERPERGRPERARQETRQETRPEREYTERVMPGFENSVWFRMSVGHKNNADPRWLLPLICRVGHVTKKEIGAIRIFEAETKFEVTRDVAERFAAAIRADKSKEVRITPASGTVGALKQDARTERPADADRREPAESAGEAPVKVKKKKKPKSGAPVT
jgi:ATP-dependent RNA helicase DeaD